MQGGFLLTDGLGENVKYWDDQNDAELLRCYHEKTGKFPYILCFTPTISIHHWKYYGQKSNNAKKEKYDDIKCSISIRYSLMEKYAKEVILKDGLELKLEKVAYLSLNELQRKHVKISANNIPFIKKKGYQVDKEYRLLLTSNQPLDETSSERHLENFLPWVSHVTFYISHNDGDVKETELREYLKSLLGENINIKRSGISYSLRWVEEIKNNTIS